jgi:anti-anti-sigma factor
MRKERTRMKDFSQIKIGPKFTWPEGEGRLYKSTKSQLFVRYYPGPTDELIVELAGEIDCYSGPSFRRLLIEAVNRGYFDFVLSLEEVEFLDSTGLGVLVGGLKRVRAHDGNIRLVCDHERILKIFRITGLTKIFSIFHSIPEALAISSSRDQVFISYSHADDRWLKELRIHLEPYVRNTAITVWDDTMIRAGAVWKEKIWQALASAKVAVLLVSPAFLASKFIAEEELPPLLEAAKTKGVAILWVPVKSSSFKLTPIADYQAAHSPESRLHCYRRAFALGRW